MNRFRNFCFTKNNYCEEDIENIKNFPDVKYMVMGFEEAPTTGTKHIQGYCELSKQISLSNLKIFGHIENRKGTAQEAANYCKKSDNYEEFGKISKTGERTDIKSVTDQIIAKTKPLNTIAIENPVLWVKYFRGFENLHMRCMTKRTTKPYIEWRWGLTGVGKTKYVIDKFAEEDLYIKNNTKWWFGYDQQKCILIDDFDVNCWPFRMLLTLFDYNKCEGETKGGHIQINSPNIYITCEFPPSKFWSGNDLDQIVRRCDKIVEITLLRGATQRLGGNSNPQLFENCM